MTQTGILEVFHVTLETIYVFFITKIFFQILLNISKFSCQKLNLLQLEYFPDPQMQIISQIHFQTTSNIMATKLMKFIFSSDKISQKGVMDVGILDHQLIYCIRMIKRIKHNMHNQIHGRSLKKYNAEAFTNALKTVQFPNYNIFSNVNVAYSDLLDKISNTIGLIVRL